MALKNKNLSPHEIEIYNFTRLKVSKNFIKRILIQALAYFNFREPVSITVLIAGWRRIQTLNKKWRNQNKVANILSFPHLTKIEIKKLLNFGSGSHKSHKFVSSNLGVLILGEIVIHSGAIKKSEFSLAELLIHGFLHLAGFDHQTSRDFQGMRKVEEKLLNILTYEK